MVQRGRRFSSHNDTVAFVEFQPHNSVHVFLAFINQGLEHLPLGREPVTVVKHVGIPGNQPVPEMHDLAIHGNRFHGNMGDSQDGSPGCFVNPARFHTHVAIFHHIHPADAVFSSQFIETGQQFRRGHGLAVHRNRVSLFIPDLNVGSLVRCVLG